MDAYERHGEDLVAQITRLRGLRDAQVPGSEDADWFQQQITARTRQLRAFDARVPDLRDMDERIAAVERRLDPVDAEVEWREGWRMRTKWLAATAGALVLAVLGVAAGWAWPVILVAALATVGCGVRSWAADNLRRQAVDEQASLDGELAVLRERQAALRSGRDPGQEMVAG